MEEKALDREVEGLYAALDAKIGDIGSNDKIYFLVLAT